uniref:Protein quiver n=1 Tax=Globodera pallida TaxID=36090 RepID=A0A183BIA8_GLOPA
MAELRDPSWRDWLEKVRMVPRTAKCADPFKTVSALRHGVRSQSCTEGICLKLWFRDHQRGGDGHVWRWCAPNGEGRLREDCTRIRSSQGELELCTCEGNLCNGSMARQIAILLG